MEVLLMVHTTAGVEFELLDAKTGDTVFDRAYVCEDYDDVAEEAAMVRVRKYCEQNGFTLTGVCWS